MLVEIVQKVTLFCYLSDFDGLNFQFSICENDLITNEINEILKNFIVNLKTELFKTTFSFKLPVKLFFLLIS